MMFEHLDDPHPPDADAATRGAVDRRAGDLARRQRRVVALGAVVLLVAAGTGVGFAVANQDGHKAGLRVATTPSTTLPGETTVPTSPTTLVTQPTLPLPPAPSTTLAPTTTTTALVGPVVSCGTLATQTGKQAATTSLGTITARLSGTVVPIAFGEPALSGATLTVSDGGKILFSEAVSPPKDWTLPAAPAVVPWGISGGGQPLCLARFTGSSQPTVLVGMTLNGAHCCTIVRAYTLPAGSAAEIDLGNPGASVVGERGVALIKTGDNNFDYAFASFAASGVPVKVLEVQGGQFVDTTRQHPDLVAADAPGQLQAFDADPGNGLGVLAAWVGDECLLNRFSTAWAAVNNYNAEGRLTGPSGWPTGSAYVSALRNFLSQHGYC
jgi:hypothetical protein